VRERVRVCEIIKVRPAWKAQRLRVIRKALTTSDKENDDGRRRKTGRSGLKRGDNVALEKEAPVLVK
jgi:hypothetical protein